ncbi:Na(+)/H(+) antiporter-like protein [Zalerion maritima]|uniref:Na(+)/H(+) antiporter-like protein n=1 Tax=Zalerion maritima TaxID=339359 RepID=A0AAD5RUK4_9PEZI|nr:Na(+)/H(+) antiporter-like protein [Zalerion maritima]
MPTTRTSDFHVVCAVFGVFTTVFAFVSYLLKERFYISESLFALIAGIISGPDVAELVVPIRWANHEVESLERVTLNLTRLALSIQVGLAACQLPGRFARTAWRPLTGILGPGMIGMWLVSSLLAWGICGPMPFLHALAVGACIAPTDPVLASTVLRGRWADGHVPGRLARLISAESGANDGLGYPFLFLALWLIKYTDGEEAGNDDEVGKAIGLWFGETIGYVVLLSVVWGAAVGWAARKALRLADSLNYVDKESFYAFSILLAILFIGTCGLVGSDDILACFVAGNALSWDDWFRDKTAPDSFEPTIDMLLNLAAFIYLGAVCPWESFSQTHLGELEAHLPLWRLVLFAIAILTLRRLPIVLGLYKTGILNPNVASLKEAMFMGFFGPIGVSAIFYLHVALEFFRQHVGPEGEPREDTEKLFEVMQTVVWFIVISSVIVHGLSIFAYQSSQYIRYHTKSRNHEKRRHYSVSRFVRQEQEWFSKLKTDEEQATEHLRSGGDHPKRPKPAFRRVKFDVDELNNREQ